MGDWRTTHPAGGQDRYVPRRVRPSGPRWGRIALALLVLLLVVATVTVFGYASHLLRRGQTDVNGLAAAAAGAPVNFLLVGADSDEGLSKAEKQRLGTGVRAGERTDTMLLVHISPRQRKVVMVSIPRDLKVDIPGHGTQKLNAAFALGGRDLLVQTVQQVTGIKVNHYVEVNFAGFLGVVDAVGRVRLCNPTNRRWNDEQYDPAHRRLIRWTSLNLGPHQCENADGAAALAFVRARHVDNDIGRITRQQQFMRVVMQRVAAGGNLINPPKLLHIANAVSKSVKTDRGLGVGDALTLARRIRSLSPAKVDMRVLPWTFLPRACATCPDYVGQTPEAPLLLKAIADDAPALPPVGIPGGRPLGLGSVRVKVLNGSGLRGAAHNAGAALARLGVKVSGTSNAPAPASGTTLAYPPRLAAQAQLLGQLLGQRTKLVPAAGGNELVLTIGPGFTPPTGASRDQVGLG